MKGSGPIELYGGRREGPATDFRRRETTSYRLIRAVIPADVELTAWQQIRMLSKVHNAIAHTNGRIEILRGRAKDRILDWEKKRIGIETNWEYIVVDRAFVEKTFSEVQSSVEDSVQRYKQWDADQKTA